MTLDPMDRSGGYYAIYSPEVPISVASCIVINAAHGPLGDGRLAVHSI